jgi:hypothetical protein
LLSPRVAHSRAPARNATDNREDEVFAFPAYALRVAMLFENLFARLIWQNEPTCHYGKSFPLQKRGNVARCDIIG